MPSRKNDTNRPSTGTAPDDERELYRKGLEGDARTTSGDHDDTRGGPTAARHDQSDQNEGVPADSRASRFHSDRDPDADSAPEGDDMEDRSEDSRSGTHDA